MFPQENSGQPAQPTEQAQPQAQPEFNIQDLIIDNPAVQAPQEAPQEAEQPAKEPEQPVQEQQTYDPYAESGGVRSARDKFEQYLDEKFPIKGKLDINQIDKKDPEAFARFMNDMQEASRNDIINQQRREDAKAEFEREIFEPVYQVYPKLKQDPVTDGLVRMLYKGASADNPNISPVQVVNAFSNFTRQLYASAVKSAQANIKTIPVTPAGQQGRAATKILNNDVVQKYASGGVDDVAQLIAGLQGRGVGGL